MPTAALLQATAPAGASTSTSPHQRFTLSRLQREWDHLVADRRHGERIVGWHLPGVCAGSTLAAVLAAAGMRSHGESTRPAGEPTTDDRATRSPTDERVPGDRVLAALVVAARTDPLAARVVLQRLLPGISALARRRSRCMDEHMRNTDEAIAAAWSVICSHPVERRPDWVASNLLRSVDYHAFVRPTRRRLSHELVEPSTMDVAVEPEELTDDPLTAILGALRLAGATPLDVSDARLIAALLRCDQLAEAARELDVSLRTVRNHRAAMIHRLRGALAA